MVADPARQPAQHVPRRTYHDTGGTHNLDSKHSGHNNRFRRDRRRDSMNNAIQPVMAALDAMRKEFGQRLDSLADDFGKRLDALNARHDKLREELPEQFVPRREFEPWVAKVSQFDEWRMGMIQKQYEQVLQLTQRQDATQTENLRDDLNETRKRNNDKAGRQFQFSLNSAGWLVALLVGLIETIGPHIHWIP